MAVQKAKPPKSSPTIEKMVQNRLQRCKETTQSAQRTIETSKRITEESRELIQSIQKNRKKNRPTHPRS